MFCLVPSLWGSSSVIYRTDQNRLYIIVGRGLQKKPTCSELALFALVLVGCLLLFYCFFLVFGPITFIGFSCFSWFQITLVRLFSYIPSIVDGWGLFRNDLELVAKHKFKIFTIGPGLWSSCEIGRFVDGMNVALIETSIHLYIVCQPGSCGNEAI